MKTIEDMMVVDFTIDFIDYLYVESLRALLCPSAPVEAAVGDAILTNK